MVTGYMYIYMYVCACVHAYILSHALICVQHSCRRLEDVLDDEKAVIVTRFLASFRSLSKSFDYLLRQVCMYCMYTTHCPALYVYGLWCTHEEEVYC